MFFKWKKSNVSSQDEVVEKKELGTMEIDLINKDKMPIITLDNSWHQLISEIKTPKILALEKELNRLLKEQGKLNTDYVEYTKLKKEMLDTILELTHDAFEEQSDDAIKKIEYQQKMILKINEKLEKIEPKLDEIPNEIRQANGTLVEESVRLCYEYIGAYREKSDTLGEEIAVIRATLMKKTEEKKLYDKQSNQLYQYLHQLVGANFIEKTDSVYWEQSE